MWNKKHGIGSERADSIGLRFFGLSAQCQEGMHDFIIKYEQIHGPTDWGRRYTSQLPIEQQEAILRKNPQNYFNGLPACMRAFFEEICHTFAREGRLDDLFDPLRFVYVKNRGKITNVSLDW